MPRTAARPAALSPILALLLLVGVVPARADSATVLYRLAGDSSLEEGCFGECDCAVWLSRLEGTFGLTAAGISDGYRIYRLTDIDWRVGENGASVRGSGTYRLGTGAPVSQQLVLDLSIDSAPVEQYDSGLVPAKAPFPRIDALASLYDLQCYDRLFHVQAAPAEDGPITFAFEGTVESVFDGLGALGGKVAPGSKFSGSFTFDPDTPNTAEPVAEGEAGLYHHDRPPAGVRLYLAGLTFRSTPAHPDFDVIVNNDFGFAGTDEFGFRSRNNQARGLSTGFPIAIGTLDWFAQTLTGDPLSSAELPLRPPDLDLLGGGVVTIRGECTLCMGPAAFFEIQGTLTSLTLPARLSLDASLVGWEGPEGVEAYDVLTGDLDALRAGGEEAFGSASITCLADDRTDPAMAGPPPPPPGQAQWFLVRPVAATPGTYDAHGLTQLDGRDEAIATQGSGCP